MGEAQGKKVAVDGVAAQTIEAQPVFGQIKPSQRPGASRAEPQSREKRWLISVDAVQEVGTVRRRKRNTMREMAESSPRATAESNVRCTSMRSRTEIDSTRSRCSEEGRDYLSLKLDDPRSTRRFTRTCSTTRVKRSSLCAWRPRELAEDCRRPPCPVRLVGAP